MVVEAEGEQATEDEVKDQEVVVVVEQVLEAVVAVEDVAAQVVVVAAVALVVFEPV